MNTIDLKGIKVKDPTKANPRKLENYTVKFPKEMAQFNGRVTVKFRHIDAQDIERCYDVIDDEYTRLSDFKIFKKCVKEVHGLRIPKLIDGNEEMVEMTVDEIVHFQEIGATTEEGDNAMSLMFVIVHDVAQTILMKSALTEQEERDLQKDVRQSSQG